MAMETGAGTSPSRAADIFSVPLRGIPRVRLASHVHMFHVASICMSTIERRPGKSGGEGAPQLSYLLTESPE